MIDVVNSLQGDFVDVVIFATTVAIAAPCRPIHIKNINSAHISESEQDDLKCWLFLKKPAFQVVLF